MKTNSNSYIVLSKRFLIPRPRPRLKQTILVIAVTMATFWYAKHFSKPPRRFLPLQSAFKDTLECQSIAEKTWRERERTGNTHDDPSKQVVDEFLEIVSEPWNGCNVLTTETNQTAVGVVLSARENFRYRQAIRESWGRFNTYKNWTFKVVFILGQNSLCNDDMATKLEQLKIEIEQETYGDLVIGSFADTYRNLTYKSLLAHKYVVSRCPNVELMIRTDDEIFVNVPAILEFRSGNNTLQYDIYCRFIDEEGPTRCTDCPNGKYFSTWEEWGDEPYPRYCNGPSLVITKEWSERIYDVRLDGGFYWIEDVFVTGKLREIAQTKSGFKARMIDISTKAQRSFHLKWLDNWNRAKQPGNIPWFQYITKNKLLLNRMKKLYEILK